MHSDTRKSTRSTEFRARTSLARVSVLFVAVVVLVFTLGCSDSTDNSVRLTVADPPAEIVATLPPTSLPPPTATPMPTTQTAAEAFPPLGPRTDWELANTQGWLNGDATSIADLRGAGEVVLVDFWTYT